MSHLRHYGLTPEPLSEEAKQILTGVRDEMIADATRRRRYVFHITWEVKPGQSAVHATIWSGGRKIVDTVLTPIAKQIVREHNNYEALLEALLAVYADIELQNVEGGSAELNVMVSSALAKAEE